MLPQHVLFALVATVAALPLNINFGAYSPAFVVGDGEISLGSTESAANLMATLQTGSTEGNGERKPPATGKPAENPKPAEAEPAKPAKRALNLSRSPVEEKLEAVKAAMAWIKRDLASFNAALGYARDTMKFTPKVELGTEKAGTGIIVNPGVEVLKGSPAAAAKRDTGVVEEDTPKLTLVTITEV